MPQISKLTMCLWNLNSSATKVDPFSSTEQKEKSNLEQCTVPLSAPPILQMPSVPIGHRDKPKHSMSLNRTLVETHRFYLEIQAAHDVVVIHNQYHDNQPLLIDCLLNSMT